MAKKSRKKGLSQATPQAKLTEWQKRNLEFQKRKEERETQQKGTKPRTLLKPANQTKGVKASKPLSADLGQASSRPVKSRPKDRRPGLARQQLRAGVTIFLTTLLFLTTLFVVSPLSKDKTFVVTGLSHTNQQAVLEATGIKSTDYISQVFLKQETYMKNLVKKDPWVKSAEMTYQFPNRFTIAVEEHAIALYHKDQAGYHPVLTSGVILTDLTQAELPAGSLGISFEQASAVKAFVEQFMTLDVSVRQSITEVEEIKTAATSDLLKLTMAEGHTVRVPLSEIGKKLPYYQAIRDRLSYPAIIDMEVGIYTTSAELETQASETKASRAKEAKELADQAAAQSAQTEQTGSSSPAQSSAPQPTVTEASTEEARTEASH